MRLSTISHRFCYFPVFSRIKWLFEGQRCLPAAYNDTGKSVCVWLECSFAESNQDTIEWEENKSVGYCLRLTRAYINGHRFVEVNYDEETPFYQSSRQHDSRRLACTTRPKGYFARRITRYPNSDSTFRFRQPAVSCPVVMWAQILDKCIKFKRSNPRENSRNACQLCERTVAQNHRTLKCTQCSLLTHKKCSGMSGYRM